MESTAFDTWVPDINRWNLPKPPDEALRMFRAYDAQLVVIPSRKSRQYLLTRRRLHSAGIGDVAMLDNKHPDTNMCYAHGLLPIAPIVSRSGNYSWGAEDVAGLIDLLKSRDTWRFTERDRDPDAAWKAVEDFEAAQEAKQQRDLRDMFYHMGRDAWRSIQARMGRRSKRASDFHGVASKPTSSGTAQGK